LHRATRQLWEFGLFWEPNKFDGKDIEFANREGHDETGRFIPYWTRETGELKLRALRSYNSAKQGNYHTLCRDAKKKFY
jgi:methyl-accepting chemotaxis protein